MASVVEVCNAAISHVGTRSKITSIDEISREAIACKTHYYIARDATLRAFDWNFARMTLGLSQISLPIPVGQTVAPTSSVARWRYEFLLPQDCVRLRKLNDVPLLLVPAGFYELAADKDSGGNPINVVFCNAPVMSALYTARIEDPNRWDLSFYDTMSYVLAQRICFELTGKLDLVKELTEMWQSKVLEAAADSANENPSPIASYVPEALAARGYDDGLAEIGQAWPRSFG